jgi:chromosome segregation ATPase
VRNFQFELIFTLLFRAESFEEVSLELQDARIVLQNQETEANEAISIWEQKAAELESELDSAEAQLVVAEEKVAELHAKCKTLGSKEKSLKAELQSLQESHDLKVKQLSQELASKSKGALEAERDRLTIVITHLEEELLEANDMVQACITDESGDKATAAVAQALREEIEGLRLQMCDYRQKYEEEQASREVAQLEIERLRNDVAALVALSEEDNALENLEKLTTKAIEKLQKRERAEIDELRKSLFRALNDLEFSRAAEKESNEQLSKVRLQLAMYEQDVIAAKSEISFLTQAMEELRETEENKRASLEYRVGSLEHENDVVKKYHTAELDTVRNELSQVTMDRDRIIHQLKEVEKTNSSLVYAASKEENLRSERTGDFEAECIKLRIENAHLLTMAADDHSRAERRLHEMLAAQSASIEADVILQTELCVSAEEAVETLKVELEALRSERCSLIQDADPTLRKLEAEHMQELESTRASLQRVQRENESLKLKMEEATRKSMKKIETLTDECRRAQSLVHKMKQEGRFEAMVRAEKSRLSNNATQSPARLGNCHGEWGNGHLEPSLSSVEAFDMVERLKQEILQERKSHREFLEEHDLLLTMLGQLDSEKTALMEALGPVASEEAIQRAHQVSAE